MIARILNQGLQNVAARLIVVGLIVLLPVGLSTAWLGAAYQVLLWNVDFGALVVRLMVSGSPAVLAGGLVLLYPLERFVIRDRAQHSWRWTGLRVALYLASSVPLGWVFLQAMHLGAGRYPAIVESSYFVIVVANIGVFALLYSLVERALAEVEKREARLRSEIRQLRIEIDDIKCARQVQEITETDYFRDLQAKARRLKQR